MGLELKIMLMETTTKVNGLMELKKVKDNITIFNYGQCIMVNGKMI